MKRQGGFTLIELVVTIAIVGIIMAIAIPGFTEQLRKSRRAEAVRGLGELQLSQERWRSNHTTYAAALAPPNGLALPTSEHYTFAITANDATDAVMTATPTGGQASDRCGTYTLRIDNNNDNAPAGQLDKTTSTGIAGCW
jgi:type IV pilus assembly protein PilE